MTCRICEWAGRGSHFLFRNGNLPVIVDVAAMRLEMRLGVAALSAD